jgi:REP element-mobilizing transposase RayT
MTSPLRIEGEDIVYHLTARGDRLEKIFRDDGDRERFLDRLEASATRFSAEIHAFVLMPNHFICWRTQGGESIASGCAISVSVSVTTSRLKHPSTPSISFS